MFSRFRKTARNEVAFATETLLQQALNFVKEHVDVPQRNIDIIMHGRKSLLFNREKAWVKRDGNGPFDVTMGCYDGAEICELVGMFALSQLTQHLDMRTVGLF